MSTNYRGSFGTIATHHHQFLWELEWQRTESSKYSRCAEKKQIEFSSNHWIGDVSVENGESKKTISMCFFFIAVNWRGVNFVFFIWLFALYRAK